MNNIITIHNPNERCPSGTTKLGDRFAILSEKTMNTSVGKFLQNYDDTKEWRSFQFCQHPLINASSAVPKDSMFMVRDGTCPANSITLGKINFLDSIAVNSEKTTSPITTITGDYLQYTWQTPTLCKAEGEVKIGPNIILPSKNCTLKNWSNYGMFGILQPQSEITISPFYQTNKNKNFQIDASNTLLSGYYIVQPQMCYGQGNKTVVKCYQGGNTIKPMLRDAMLCDEEMKMLCGKKEYQEDPICSCFYSNTTTLSNPACIDEMCNKEGYKTQGQLKTPCAISNVPIDCTKYNRIKDNNPNTNLIRNEWTDYCFVKEEEEKQEDRPIQITERSDGKYWFTDARMRIVLIVLLLILSLAFLYFYIPNTKN